MSKILVVTGMLCLLASLLAISSPTVAHFCSYDPEVISDKPCGPCGPESTGYHYTYHHLPDGTHYVVVDCVHADPGQQDVPFTPSVSGPFSGGGSGGWIVWVILAVPVMAAFPAVEARPRGSAIPPAA